MIEIESPNICNINIWRDWVRNNEDIKFVTIIVHTTETWLPKILVDIGLFDSNSEVKRNRPEFWRDASLPETLKIGVFRVTIEE